MEKLDKTVLKINLPTKEINTKIIQDVMSIVKKNSIHINESKDIYNDVLERLWLHLTSDLLEFDDQLLCCTCFFSALRHSEKNESYLLRVLQIISNEVTLKELNSKENSKAFLAVSLCYGLFQSTYLIREFDTVPEVLKSTLPKTFQLLTLTAYEYSQYTFIVFKIIIQFKKVIGTQYEKYFFNKSNIIKLLNLTNHNWENPITGVKNLNRIVFNMLILVLTKEMKEKIFMEINEFYWNKAKYLMLAEVVEHQNDDIEKLIIKNRWIDGLIYSLHEPGLVSAGADMYYAILNKLRSDESWQHLFLDNVIQILVGPSHKAIENFTNYWCLVTFKKFPSLMSTLVFHLQQCNIGVLYSTICVLKQGNKLGLIDKKWTESDYNEEEKLVLDALENSNTAVRMLSFEILCICNGKHLPTKVLFEKVLQFLRNNVNSDCTLLRISMLNNLGDFFIALHSFFLNCSNDGHFVENLQIFCKELQIFIIESLNLDGNYQRKITTVKIASLILKHFNTIPKKKQQQMRNLDKTLVGNLKETQKWFMSSQEFIMKLVSLLKDPSSDVHNNVLQILLNFYLTDFSETATLNHLIEEGLICIRNKFFFEISCGLNMFKLIISIILKNNIVEGNFKTIEDIYSYAYDEVTNEYETKRNVVESVTQGKQLHAFLSILDVIYNAALNNSHCIKISNETIHSLLSMLKDISKQFVWEDSRTSSDFSEINDMVQSIINSSGIETECKYDQTKNSGLYQIVLNSLWLNVKATCELASTMIQYYKENVKICEECLDIISHVLETSRHKGAIEGAGAALGHGIRCLTSLNSESDVSQIPFTFLKTKLYELLSETSKMSSVTRRGAGLTIMVYRIVTNDCQKGKPLFHFFMKTMLATCDNLQTHNCDEGNQNAETDIPKAIYIHFLTKIVTDSSLSSDIMYYSAELAELAFSGLTNPHWQIRNAALQLYGALIPKLIGQKKTSGDDEDEITSSVACDEFRTHSPKLWNYIVEQIKNSGKQDIVQKHSNLVPILNTLGNIAKRYNFSYDLKVQLSYDLILLPYLLNLLDSPIYTVRRLTSRAITNLFTMETVYDAIKKQDTVSENLLNGILMVIERCYKVYSHNEVQKIQLNNLRDEYQTIVMKGNHSCLSKWSLEKLYNEENFDLTIEMVEKMLETEKSNRHEPGTSLWVKTKIQKYLEVVQWEHLPKTLHLVLYSCEFEGYCEIILNRLIATENQSSEILIELSKVLLSSDLSTKSSILWKTLYNISRKINLPKIDSSFIQEYLAHDVSFKLRYIIPFSTRYFLQQQDNENLLLITRKIYMLCNPKNYDVDLRFIAAIANNELSYKFKSLTEEVKINAIMSAVILLQDENDDIRDLNVIFHRQVFKLKSSKHPFICLDELLNKEFLYSALEEPQQSISNICKELLIYIDSISCGIMDEFNPFNNVSRNIYLEVKRIQDILRNLN